MTAASNKKEKRAVICSVPKRMRANVSLGSIVKGITCENLIQTLKCSVDRRELEKQTKKASERSFKIRNKFFPRIITKNSQIIFFQDGKGERFYLYPEKCIMFLCTISTKIIIILLHYGLSLHSAVAIKNTQSSIYN